MAALSPQSPPTPYFPQRLTFLFPQNQRTKGKEAPWRRAQPGSPERLGGATGGLAQGVTPWEESLQPPLAGTWLGRRWWEWSSHLVSLPRLFNLCALPAAVCLSVQAARLGQESPLASHLLCMGGWGKGAVHFS